MKKKVLAVFMAVFVTVGTVLAPAETGSVMRHRLQKSRRRRLRRKRKQNCRKKCRVRKLKPKLGRSRLEQRVKIQKMTVRRSRKPE